MASGPLSVPKKVSVGVEGEVLNIYNEISSIPVGGTANIVTYTVPVGKVFFLLLAEFSGENIAVYTVFRDTAEEAKRRTHFGGDLTGEFYFNNLPILAGEQIKISVENFRDSPANFDGRILGTLDDDI